MSPIPKPSQSNPVNGESSVASEEVIINEEVGDEINNEYQMLTQQNENQPIDDEDSEESDDDDDDEVEIDPDLDFEQLAITRAYIQQQGSTKLTNSIELNHNLFEVDFFERKVKLECEDIVLDENKTKKITEIMSNFKLDDKFIPNWAKLVPEDAWKKNLIDSLNAKKTDLFENQKN